MNYILTGATGFVGRSLVNQLLAKGQSVNYTGRKRNQTLDSRAAFHHWDVANGPDLGTVATLDAVVNLAGEPIAQRWSSDVKRRIYDSRIKGTRQLVQAIERLRTKPAVLVSASAVGFYGDRGDEVLTEAAPAGSGFLADVCVDWEKEALRAEEFGVRVVLLRIAMVLGKGGGALKQMLVPFRLGVGGKFGSGEQWVPWVHLQDLVDMIVFAAENPTVRGPLNASVPHPINNAEFTAALGRAIHRPAFLPIPKFVLSAALGELAGFILSSQRVLPSETEKSGFHFRHPDIGAALVELTS